MFSRNVEKSLLEALEKSPVTALIGPRQCGKSTLTKAIAKRFLNALYLDLQRPSDLRKLDDPEWFFPQNADALICLDEVQHKPELFPVIRSIVDIDRRPGRFLLTGPAALNLLKQTSETLAGRVRILEMTPFSYDELPHGSDLTSYLWKGGFPLSWLATSNEDSFRWREDFITTFLERDLSFFSGFATNTMRNLWSMLAFENGQTLNLSKLGSSLGVSYNTIARYVDLLEGTFMVHQVQAWQGNTIKRLLKAPKVYVADSGITTALLEIPSPSKIFGHPGLAGLWEGLVLSHLKSHFNRLDISYYRTSNGAEMDFIIRRNGKTICLECKASVAPDVTKGFWNVLDDIKPDMAFIVAPVDIGYQKAPNVKVVSLMELMKEVRRAI